MKQEKKIAKNRLREFRIFPNKTSQWQLALDSNVRQSRISLIENFLVTPSAREKILLSTALKKEMEDIFPKNEH